MGKENVYIDEHGVTCGLFTDKGKDNSHEKKKAAIRDEYSDYPNITSFPVRYFSSGFVAMLARKNPDLSDIWSSREMRIPPNIKGIICKVESLSSKENPPIEGA